jgi:hypothetical protein
VSERVARLILLSGATAISMLAPTDFAALSAV